MVRRGKVGNSQHFPTNLHTLLDEAEKGDHSHIVSWCSQGQSFKIYDQEDLVPLLAKYFRQTKFKSFLRQLQSYGFNRTTRGCNRGVVSHPLFMRGRRSLCFRMSRKQSTTTDSTHTSSSTGRAAASASAAAAASHSVSVLPRHSAAVATSSSSSSSSANDLVYIQAAVPVPVPIPVPSNGISPIRIAHSAPILNLNNSLNYDGMGGNGGGYIELSELKNETFEYQGNNKGHPVQDIDSRHHHNLNLNHNHHHSMNNNNNKCMIKKVHSAPQINTAIMRSANNDHPNNNNNNNNNKMMMQQMRRSSTTAITNSTTPQQRESILNCTAAAEIDYSMNSSSSSSSLSLSSSSSSLTQTGDIRIAQEAFLLSPADCGLAAIPQSVPSQQQQQQFQVQVQPEQHHAQVQQQMMQQMQQCQKPQVQAQHQVQQVQVQYQQQVHVPQQLQQVVQVQHQQEPIQQHQVQVQVQQQVQHQQEPQHEVQYQQQAQYQQEREQPQHQVQQHQHEPQHQQVQVQQVLQYQLEPQRQGQFQQVQQYQLEPQHYVPVQQVQHQHEPQPQVELVYSQHQVADQVNQLKQNMMKQMESNQEEDQCPSTKFQKLMQFYHHVCDEQQGQQQQHQQMKCQEVQYQQLVQHQKCEQQDQQPRLMQHQEQVHQSQQVQHHQVQHDRVGPPQSSMDGTNSGSHVVHPGSPVCSYQPSPHTNPNPKTTIYVPSDDFDLSFATAQFETGVGDNKVDNNRILPSVQFSTSFQSRDVNNAAITTNALSFSSALNSSKVLDSGAMPPPSSGTGGYRATLQLTTTYSPVDVPQITSTVAPVSFSQQQQQQRHHVGSSPTTDAAAHHLCGSAETTTPSTSVNTSIDTGTVDYLLQNGGGGCDEWEMKPEYFTESQHYYGLLNKETVLDSTVTSHHTNPRLLSHQQVHVPHHYF